MKLARVCDSKYLRTVAAVGHLFRTIPGRERLELGDDLNPMVSELRRARVIRSTDHPRPLF